MTPLEVGTFAQRVEAVIDVVRDALGRIEEAAQKDDDPRWMQVSRRFAVLLSPMRDYLNGLLLGRDLPHRLAERLAPLVAELTADEGAVDVAQLRDHVQVVKDLVASATSR